MFHIKVPPIYDLDCTNIEEWNSKVLESAIEIINAKLRGDVHTRKPLNGSSLDEKFSDSSNEESHWCEVKIDFFVFLRNNIAQL